MRPRVGKLVASDTIGAVVLTQQRVGHGSAQIRWDMSGNWPANARSKGRFEGGNSGGIVTTGFLIAPEAGVKPDPLIPK
jgi:hypothetical protein